MSKWKQPKVDANMCCIDVNLREVGLEGAEKGPGLHMFRDKFLCSEHVQTESLPGWTQVLVNFFVVLWM